MHSVLCNSVFEYNEDPKTNTDYEKKICSSSCTKQLLCKNNFHFSQKVKYKRRHIPTLDLKNKIHSYPNALSIVKILHYQMSGFFHLPFFL